MRFCFKSWCHISPPSFVISTVGLSGTYSKTTAAKTTKLLPSLEWQRCEIFFSLPVWRFRGVTPCSNVLIWRVGSVDTVTVMQLLTTFCQVQTQRVSVCLREEDKWSKCRAGENTCIKRVTTSLKPDRRCTCCVHYQLLTAWFRPHTLDWFTA